MGKGMSLKRGGNRGALSVQARTASAPCQTQVVAPSLAELQGPEMTWDGGKQGRTAGSGKRLWQGREAAGCSKVRAAGEQLCRRLHQPAAAMML